MFDYADAVDDALQEHGGQWVAPPLEIFDDEFENPGSPSHTEPSTTDVLLFAEFPTLADYQGFAADRDEVDAQATLDTALVDRIRLRTTVEAPVPLFATFPIFGNQPLRDRPAVVLHNAIKLNESGPPLDYIAKAVPMAQANGIQFFRPYSILEVLEGECDFNIVFITEWRSRGGLNKFHHSREWLNIVPTRTSHFANLIEAIGRFDIE